MWEPTVDNIEHTSVSDVKLSHPDKLCIFVEGSYKERALKEQEWESFLARKNKEKGYGDIVISGKYELITGSVTVVENSDKIKEILSEFQQMKRHHQKVNKQTINDFVRIV